MAASFNGSIDSLKRQIELLEKVKSMTSQVPKQSPVDEAAPQLESHQVALLKLYDEFIKTDEGKALSANLQRFARYVQSRQNKLEW